jgi:hypothetical protein
MRPVTLNNQKLNNPLDSAATGEVAPRPLRTLEPADEPTRLERLIVGQFRRGIPVPLTPKETGELGKMNLAQRCDHIAKIIVWSARAVERHIRESDPDK